MVDVRSMRMLVEQQNLRVHPKLAPAGTAELPDSGRTSSRIFFSPVDDGALAR